MGIVSLANPLVLGDCMEKEMVNIRKLTKEQVYRLYFILEDRINWIKSEYGIADDQIMEIRNIQDKIYESLPEERKKEISRG